jgi:SAM-dependent methyltransferase
VARWIGLGRRFPRPGIADFAEEGDRTAWLGEARNDLERLLACHSGRLMHKWRHYLEIYDTHLARFRGGFIPPSGGEPRGLRLLELGVSHGGSLQLWRKYFGAGATIVGIDIDPACRAAEEEGERVRIGSQADAAFLRAVVEEMGGVDVVIDDGSHVSAHQRASFDTLFPLLSDGGVYIAEDLHASYWPGYHQGGWRRRGTFIEATKSLVDDMHGWYHRRRLARPYAKTEVHGVHFYDSVVVVEKRRRPRPSHTRIGAPSF